MMVQKGLEPHLRDVFNASHKALLFLPLRTPFCFRNSLCLTLGYEPDLGQLFPLMPAGR